MEVDTVGVARESLLRVSAHNSCIAAYASTALLLMGRAWYNSELTPSQLEASRTFLPGFFGEKTAATGTPTGRAYAAFCLCTPAESNPPNTQLGQPLYRLPGTRKVVSQTVVPGLLGPLWRFGAAWPQQASELTEFLLSYFPIPLARPGHEAIDRAANFPGHYHDLHRGHHVSTNIRMSSFQQGS